MSKQIRPVTDKDITAEIVTTEGTIKVMFFPDAAPQAVENFTTHSENGYYDGIIFHRVIPDFMIQCGDPTGTGMGGESIWGHSFRDEFSVDYHNIRGALCMANAGPGTNGSQFFIVQASDCNPGFLDQMKQIPDSFPADCVADYENFGGTPWLDFRHTVFGQVYEGMDVVDKIASVERDQNDKPLNPISIVSVKVNK